MIVATMIFVSCGSTPKAPENVVEEPVNEEVEEKESTVVDNSSAIDKAESARKSAIEAGADKVASEQFATVDALYQSLKVLSESGKDVSKELTDVQNRFAALEQYAKALESKKRVEDLNFITYDQVSYDNGCSSLAELERLFLNPSATGEELVLVATKARGNFDSILFMAFKKLAKDERVLAFNAKKNADGVKSGVSAKAEYSSAIEEFKAGDSSYSMQNPESALSHYGNSKNQFEKLYQSVSEKRAAAQKAIDEAKQKVLESQNYAQNADVEAPLTEENVQGIEASDAVLLESDEYEDPKTLEVDVPEVIEDSSESEISSSKEQDSVQEAQ